MTFKFELFLLVNPKLGLKRTVTKWWTVNIDPRGHFTRFRFAAIVTFDKILKRFPCFEKPLVEFCMFLSCYPTF
jgi:hypothetical protein